MMQRPLAATGSAMSKDRCLNSVATAQPPPVGEASVQEISLEIWAFRSASDWTERIRKQTISSSSFQPGLTSAFTLSVIFGNISSRIEKRGLRKAATKAAFPVQWRRWNSLHTSACNMPKDKAMKFSSLSRATFKTPVLPSQVPSLDSARKRHNQLLCSVP